MKKKISWFLTYYGLTVLAVTAGTLIVGYFLWSVFGPRDEAPIQGIVVSGVVSQDDCDEMAGDLETVLGERAEVTSYVRETPYGLQAFSVRITSGDLAFVIVQESEKKELLSNGYANDCVELTDDSEFAKKYVKGSLDGGENAFPGSDEPYYLLIPVKGYEQERSNQIRKVFE